MVVGGKKMKDRWYRKGLVLGIIVLFIGSCLVPGISGKHGSSKDNEESLVNASGVTNTATLALHTFEETSEKNR